VGLIPGGTTQVKAKVVNLGELQDSITLSIENSSEAGVKAMVNDPIVNNIDSGDYAEFNITIISTEDSEPGEINLIGVATSGKALEFGKIVEDKANLTVKIITMDKPEDDKRSDGFPYWIIVVIVIIIILFLIISFYVLKKRKKDHEEAEKVQSLEDAITVEPDTIPKIEIKVQSIPTVAPAEQLPEETTAEEVSTPVLATVTTPQLPKMTPSVETPELQIVSQESEMPQLPSAQPETDDTIEESAEESTTEPNQE
jgi:hypothetical protein